MSRTRILKPSIKYATTLRAIGQGLETLRVEAIELEVREDRYLFHGYGSQPQPPDKLIPSFFKEPLHYLQLGSKNRSDNQTAAKKSLSYEFAGLQVSQNDTDDFDRRAKGSLPSLQDRLNPRSVLRILRLVGTYLDFRKSCMLKLSWRNQSATLRRRDGLGVGSKEIFTPTNLYDLWVHRYKQRRSVDPAPAMIKRAVTEDHDGRSAVMR